MENFVKTDAVQIKSNGVGRWGIDPVWMVTVEMPTGKLFQARMYQRLQPSEGEIVSFYTRYSALFVEQKLGRDEVAA